MSLPKGPYDPKLNEKEMLKFWLDNKFYSPEFSSERDLSTAHKQGRETFTIILPPPNANGNLHLGHMSGYAYQDLMARFNRMQGKQVLLLPGKDHAGIQTEVVFEQELTKKGKGKKDLGREAFYRACYEFCMKNSERARNQEKDIGLSADFDRELFTLDPRIVDNILQAFILMHKDELIYRGKRLINWCPRCQSALADIDTEFKDATSTFYYFKYAFTKPEPKAIAIKEEYAGRQINWTFERNLTRDKKKRLPFAFGKTADGLEVIGIGYPEKIKDKSKLSGAAIGIQMSLTNNFRLVVQSQDFKGDLHSELNKIFLFEIGYYPGTHIILFAEYPDDSFYTNGFLMGTVRPETKFGDTAIAVSPDDERYKKFVGKQFEVMTLNGPAKINVIADKAVDKEFGTGAVKVTPAHAPEDWDIAQRHPKQTLPEKQVIDFQGKMNHLAGKYEGMEVGAARKAMIPDMKAIGMLIMLDETYKNRIRICERCKHPIEPLISHQWFVDTRPLKQKAKELVEKGFTEIMPEGKKRTYFDWMKSEEDWCITRQLWWGYRLPVWYRGIRQEYVAEGGEVREKVGDKIMHSEADYKQVMRVSKKRPGTNLTAIRHGETDDNIAGIFIGWTDPELNANGREQAKRFAESVKADSSFDLVLTSPLQRAHETGTIIAKILGIPVEKNDLLKERNFGELDGLTWKEFSEKHPDLAKKNSETYQEFLPHGESIPDVEARVDRLLAFLKQNHADQNVLLVTHAGVIRILKRKLAGQDLASSRTNDPDFLGATELNLSLFPQLILVPGKHGYARRAIFKQIQAEYPGAIQLDVNNIDDPEFADYLKEFQKLTWSENATVVTHSLGAPAMIDYLLQTKRKIATLIMLAPPNPTSQHFDKYKQKGFWTSKDKLEDLKDHVGRIVIIHSDDDEHTSVDDLKLFAEAIGTSERYLEKGKKHYAAVDYDQESPKLENLLSQIAASYSPWIQDDDVLDTWFSSGQWPYVTLKARPEDFDKFYPSQVMETGWDILLFWVTRMMLLDPYRAMKDGISDEKRQVPFADVYLHGLVLDKKGIKMSKSKGNGIDPFEMMTKYGTDALRFSFVVGNSVGQNYRLYEEKIASYRNFCNKIWNAGKFVLSNIGDSSVPLYTLQQKDLELTAEDKTMLKHLQDLTKATTTRIKSFSFGFAAQELYESFWHTFADVYIEQIKNRLYTKDKEGNAINTSDEAKASRLAAQWSAYHCLEVYLKMLHPFVPFITEKVWQELPHHKGESETIMYAAWPKPQA